MPNEDGSRPDYFQTLALVEQLIARLEGFVAGRETNDSLLRWAREVHDHTQEGPLVMNPLADWCFTNALNAGHKLPSGAYILRVEDAQEYLAVLRAGWSGVRMAFELHATSSQPLTEIANLLQVKIVRDVLPGLGWMESLTFASRATGRQFAMRRSLEFESQGALLNSERRGDARDCLVDLLETLAIDRDDLSYLSDEFAAAELPRWALWRQDDNGQREVVATFTGRRKAERRRAELEARGHKQTYWVQPA